MTKGYLFLALGKFYIDEVYNLVLTINKHNDNKPKSIVVLKEDLEYANSLNVFDRVLEFQISELYNICTTEFEKYGSCPKLKIKDYLIYDETIVLDSDVLCICNTESLWDWLSTQSKDIVMLGFESDPEWHWGNWGKVCESNGFEMPHTHSGFFYLRKNSNLIEPFFRYATEAFLTYEKLHFLKWFRGGKAEEPCFAYAHAKINLKPVDYREFPVMTFNLTKDQTIPTMLQATTGAILDGYIPFVHMFEKKDGENYKDIFERITKK
jgi:hypothetical protein